MVLRHFDESSSKIILDWFKLNLSWFMMMLKNDHTQKMYKTRPKYCHLKKENILQLTIHILMRVIVSKLLQGYPNFADHRKQILKYWSSELVVIQFLNFYISTCLHALNLQTCKSKNAYASLNYFLCLRYSITQKVTIFRLWMETHTVMLSSRKISSNLHQLLLTLWEIQRNNNFHQNNSCHLNFSKNAVQFLTVKMVVCWLWISWEKDLWKMNFMKY